MLSAEQKHMHDTEFEIKQILKVLDDYSDIIVEHFDRELPKHDMEEITALCYLISENYDFVNICLAYVELYDTMIDLEG